MKDERKGQNKQEIVKEAKENEELYQFVKSLTKEEIQRIKEQREFDSIEPGTYTWKVAVLCDTIRSNVRMLRSKITKRMINVGDLGNEIVRLKAQIASGDIQEKSKNGVTMNKYELESYIQTLQWTRQGEVDALPMALAELRALVGHKDVAKRVVMSKAEFEEYAAEINERLSKQGFDMFKELA